MAISNEKCNTEYKELGGEIHNSNICTFTKGGEGACHVSINRNINFSRY